MVLFPLVAGTMVYLIVFVMAMIHFGFWSRESNSADVFHLKRTDDYSGHYVESDIVQTSSSRPSEASKNNIPYFWNQRRHPEDDKDFTGSLSFKKSVFITFRSGGTSKGKA